MSSGIRVKLLSPLTQRYFMHQFPGGIPAWGNCQFSFAPEDRDYDWLVVYEDLPGLPDVPRNRRCEELACAAAHTLLTTTEPSSIKHYGNPYTRQFGCVLTSQEEWALPHRDRIFSQAGLAWIYGVGEAHEIPFDDMLARPPAHKTRDLSMVFSPKRQRHTLHHRRNRFMRQLMDEVPEMDVYGRGARPLDDKAEALDAYRYHVAVENFIGPHHWTEKLADAFLGMTLPFYCGCPNATDYFPPESFIPVDMNDPQGAAHIIRSAIAAGEYERRLSAIIEARRRVLYEYNLFAVLAREIEKRHHTGLPGDTKHRICSRHALRRHSLTGGLQDSYGKARARLIHLFRRG
ncbi:MAG: glycosyltransferase family 10 [Gammaproteobacteria bacterium]